MPPLHLRQEFPTLKAFKEALHAWAIESHFEPRILKSDTGRVRVGCKRDPNCPFVIRCNWERKNGREPLARVTVLRDRHTCVNAMDWRVGGNAMANGLGSNDGMGGHVPILGSHDGNHNGAPGMMGVANMVGGQNMAHGAPGLGIREDDNGNIVGGARVLGPMSPRSVQQHAGQAVVPVLPKVQRNSASRLPFLMEILPRLMSITKETTPGEIREVLLKEFGAEVHLQQCRRAKTEILKKRAAEGGEAESSNNNQTQTGSGQGGGSIDGIGENEDAPADTTPQMFDGNISVNSVSNGHNGSMNGAGPGAEQEFQLHTASGVVIPQVPRRSEAALASVGESPVRCPYCVNHRWLRSIKDAVEHLSMHVVV